MRVARLCAFLFLGIGASLFCSDLMSVSHGTYSPSTLASLWESIEPTSLNMLPGLLGRKLVLGPPFTWLLGMPAWPCFTLIGAVLGVLDLSLLLETNEERRSRIERQRSFKPPTRQTGRR